MMYCHIGNCISCEVIGKESVGVGKQFVSQLAPQLQKVYGTRVLESRNIRRMMKFAQLMPNLEIVSPLATQLSRLRLVEILSLQTEPHRVSSL